MTAPVLNLRSASSRKEYKAYLDDLLIRAERGELTLDEDARWSHGAQTNEFDHHDIVRAAKLDRVKLNVLIEKDYIDGWPDRNPGQGIA